MLQFSAACISVNNAELIRKRVSQTHVRLIAIVIYADFKAQCQIYPVKFHLKKQWISISQPLIFLKELDEHFPYHQVLERLKCLNHRVSQRIIKTIQAEDQPAHLYGASSVYNLCSHQWAAILSGQPLQTPNFPFTELSSSMVRSKILLGESLHCKTEPYKDL